MDTIVVSVSFTSKRKIDGWEFPPVLPVRFLKGAKGGGPITFALSKQGVILRLITDRAFRTTLATLIKNSGLKDEEY